MYLPTLFREIIRKTSEQPQRLVGRYSEDQAASVWLPAKADRHHTWNQVVQQHLSQATLTSRERRLNHSASVGIKAAPRTAQHGAPTACRGFDRFAQLSESARLS